MRGAARDTSPTRQRGDGATRAGGGAWGLCPEGGCCQKNERGRPTPPSTIEGSPYGEEIGMAGGPLHNTLVYLRRLAAPGEAGALSDAELLERFVRHRDEA